jgi:hypothetical protein
MAESPRRPSGLVVLALVVVTDLIVVIGGLVLANRNRPDTNDAYTAAGICASAVITLVGLVYYLIGVRGNDSAEAFRHSIAATFMLIYLLLVTISAFPDQPTATGNGQSTNLPPITGTLLNNFTTLAGIIAAFYFGGTIVEKVIRRDEARNSTLRQADDSSEVAPASSETNDERPSGI